MHRPFAILAAMCTFALPGQAHEFWIAPERYQVSEGEGVVAAFRNGEELEGSSLSYVPARAARYDMIVGGETYPVPVRIGDNPAFRVEGLPDGLLTIVHETSDALVTYREKDGRSGWERFLGFAEHKDFPDAEAEHLARGLPQEGITERYRRYAKALVAVGSGMGEDRATGLRTEIVALANPYTDALAGGLPVRVLLEGEPRADAQVELFARAPDGSVEVTLHRTDASGVAMLPVAPGHEYLADAVTLLPVEEGAADGAMWETLWAALTFAVPGA
ncbi:DUF4198 domain-containing protein [Jannaschia sp. W003]|uniref:DUF4198 domain-containing protein n=1 Tax=Jannaschia sp. W003 TaxID=2867012 RepID=UPI0021A2EC39|nr:DUF4198 domain-containing protein [Jannaschia sp. W003]UWQ21876.1 DUF4198 domain-containing protein [Jannaschia sp. W003]